MASAIIDLGHIKQRLDERCGPVPFNTSGFREQRGRTFPLSFVSNDRDDLIDFSKWKEAEKRGDRASVHTRNKKHVLARHFKDMDSAARTFFSLVDLTRAKQCTGVETPLALFFPSEGGGIAVTSFHPGVTLRTAYETKKLAGNRVEICCRAAETLANVHVNGVIHQHPHPLNFMVDGERVTLVDMKYVLFKDFSRNKPKQFFDDVAQFLVMVRGGWRPEYSIEILFDNREVETCMRAYLATVGMTEALDYAMRVYSIMFSELGQSARAFENRRRSD